MKNTIYLLLFPFLFLFQTDLKAQFAEKIRTGRPGQSIGAYAVGKNVFQLQAGGNLSNFYLSDSENISDDKVFAGTAVLRYGLTEKLEVSAVGTYRNNDLFGAESNEQSGISNTQIGLRYNILQNKGIIPAVGLQGRLLLRAQSDDFQRDNTGAKVILATGNKLTDNLSLTTNLGFTWAGNGGPAKTNYSAILSVSLGEKWSTFAEIYGSFDVFSTNFDTGLAYFCTPDLKFDISAGLYGRNSLNYLFLDAGLSWRWHKR